MACDDAALPCRRPYDLDEAMHRRISLVLEFHVPSPPLREKIWECHVPAHMRGDNVDMKARERSPADD